MLEANDMVEAKLAEIRERKMYEMKRMYAARMDEIFGALSKADIEARRKAGYKKASEVLGDPREKERKSKRLNPNAKILKHKVSEEALDEAGLGDAAKVAHSMDPNQTAAFKALMGVRRWGKKTAVQPKEKGRYPDTPGGRNREKLDKWVAKNPPGSAVVDTTKLVGSGVTKAAKALGHELGSIGFTNLE